MGGPRPWAEAPVAAPLISKLKRKKSPTCLNRYHWHQFRNLLNTFWENFLWGGMIKMINEHWSYHTFIMMTMLLKVSLEHWWRPGCWRYLGERRRAAAAPPSSHGALWKIWCKIGVRSVGVLLKVIHGINEVQLDSKICSGLINWSNQIVHVIIVIWSA